MTNWRFQAATAAGGTATYLYSSATAITQSFTYFDVSASGVKYKEFTK